MRIDFKEILPLIDIYDFQGGSFHKDIRLPDGRSIEFKGSVEIRGTRIHNYFDPDDNGYFEGTVEFTLSDWTGFDRDGREIMVTNHVYFQNKMQELLEGQL